MGAIILWIVVAIGVFAIDILSSSFCFILLAVGAILAAICSALGLNFIGQVIVFAIANIISVSVGYPILKKKFKGGFRKTLRMEETYIGKIIQSDKEIKDKAQIKVKGEYWTVVNQGTKIEAGEKFKIIGIEGIKLMIQKVEEENI